MRTCHPLLTCRRGKQWRSYPASDLEAGLRADDSARETDDCCREEAQVVWSAGIRVVTGEQQQRVTRQEEADKEPGLREQDQEQHHQAAADVGARRQWTAG